MQRFAVDSTTRWRRVYNLGSSSQLLVVIRQESKAAPVRVDLITDSAAELVMHWGSCAQGGCCGRFFTCSGSRVPRPQHVSCHVIKFTTRAVHGACHVNKHIIMSVTPGSAASYTSLH